MHIRSARPADLPAIREIIEASVRGLSRGWYPPEQIDSLLRHIFGPDTQLIADGTYYVVESENRLAACGGWSRRTTLYGGDQAKATVDPLLQPGRDPARIRAFFVHPEFARRGLGRRLFERCADEAAAAGFDAFTLVATLSGEPLYRALGFEVVRRFQLPMPDGVSAEAVDMRWTRRAGDVGSGRVSPHPEEEVPA